MKILRTLALITVILGMNSRGLAESAKSASKGPSNRALEVIIEPIERLEETKKEFLVLVRHHPAFYRITKKPQSETATRDFLNERLKRGIPIHLQFDPLTTMATSIAD